MPARPCALLALAPLLVLAACTGSRGTADAPDLAAVFGGGAGTWVDLTWAFSDSTIYWPTDTMGFVHDTVSWGTTPGGFFYSSFRYGANEHGGTHLDAPLHFAAGRDAADQIPLTSLIGPAVVIDVSDKADADYLASVEDLAAWEAAHGRIPDGAIVLLRTGWGDRYHDRTAYLGTDATGPEAVPLLHFPALAPEAAQWLVDNRAPRAFGLDTPSVDRGQSRDFGVHVILYGANIPGFENVAHLEQLPATGSFVVALPMKIKDGSGGPLRIVAYVP
jgi:kynurenine formamidase